jgi:hypothetical protein
MKRLQMVELVFVAAVVVWALLMLITELQDQETT